MPHSRELFVEKGLIHGTLVRRLEKGQEVGPLMVVDSNYCSGAPRQKDFVKYINVFEIDTQGDEPVILPDEIKLFPHTKVRVIGTFAIDPKDRYWKYRANDIRKEYGF